MTQIALDQIDYMQVHYTHRKLHLLQLHLRGLLLITVYIVVSRKSRHG